MNRRKYKNVKVSILENYWLILPEDHNVVSLDCPVCNTLLSGKEDVLSYKQNGCCKLCTDVFVYPNRQKWDEGWRPGPDEIASQREKRRAIPSYIL